MRLKHKRVAQNKSIHKSTKWVNMNNMSEWNAKKKSHRIVTTADVCGACNGWVQGKQQAAHRK